MTFAVRHLEPADHDAVHQMMRSPHILAGTMVLPYTSADGTRTRLADRRGAFRLVAENDGSLAGSCELLTHPTSHATGTSARSTSS